MTTDRGEREPGLSDLDRHYSWREVSHALDVDGGDAYR